MMLGTGRLLVALSLILGTAIAQASSPHCAWVRAAIARLPVCREDIGIESKPAQLDDLAALVADSPAPAGWPKREWAALLLTIARHESTLSLRIQRGECKPHECDGGKAVGLWQQHEFSWNADRWEAMPGNLALQVQVAGEALTRSYLTCKSAKVPRVQSTISAYAGRGCGAEWKGLNERLETFGRLVRVVVPQGGAS